jgi:hypothetical protein
VEAHNHLRCVVRKEGNHQLTLQHTAAATPHHRQAGRQAAEEANNRAVNCQQDDV